VKIGTRITVTTVVMVLLTLGLYGYLSVRQRQKELNADLERQTELVGTAVQVAFEAAIQDGLFEDVSVLIRRWQAAEPGIGLGYIDLLHTRPGQPPPAFVVGDTPDGGHPYVPPPPDPTRGGRLNRMTIDKVSVGEHVQIGDRPTATSSPPSSCRATRPR